MRVYLDVSCLNRPSDDQSQARIRLETEAICIIAERFDSGVWRHVSSEMALIEIEAGRDARRKRQARMLLPSRQEIMMLTEEIWSRAADLQKFGFKPADAVHIAAAEAQRADAFVTCDDRLLRIAKRNRTRLHVRCCDPVSCVEEHQ